MNTNSRSTCTVGCKLPNGITLELGKKNGPKYQVVKLVGVRRSPRVVGGYSLTDGVPQDFMTEWLKQNARLSFVRKGLIFIHNDIDSAAANAKENADIKTGLEPLDPMHPELISRGVEPDKDHLKRLRESAR